MIIFSTTALPRCTPEELDSNLQDSALWLAVEAESGFFEELPHISTVERSQIWIDTVLDFAELEALDILGNPQGELDRTVRQVIRELRSRAQAEFTATRDIHGVIHSMFDRVEEREARIASDGIQNELSRSLRLVGLILGRDLRG